VPRPSANRKTTGETSGEVRKRLGCRVSDMRRMQATGVLPRIKDDEGNFRFCEEDVANARRYLGRQGLEGRIAQLHRYFAVRGFRLTRDELGRITQETGESDDFVLSQWAKYSPPPA
jgi:hypothetical protein